MMDAADVIYVVYVIYVTDAGDAMINFKGRDYETIWSGMRVQEGAEYRDNETLPRVCAAGAAYRPDGDFGRVEPDAGVAVLDFGGACADNSFADAARYRPASFDTAYETAVVLRFVCAGIASSQGGAGDNADGGCPEGGV